MNMTGGILKKFSTKTYWFWEITQGTPPPYLKTLLLKLNDQFNIIFHCFCIGGTVLSSDTACHFSKWVKSKNKSGNGFPGQRGLYRVQKYQLEKNWSGKFWVLRNSQVSRRGKNWVKAASCWIWRPYCAVLGGWS